jgi:hypothetical protein
LVGCGSVGYRMLEHAGAGGGARAELYRRRGSGDPGRVPQRLDVHGRGRCRGCDRQPPQRLGHSAGGVVGTTSHPVRRRRVRRRQRLHPGRHADRDQSIDRVLGLRSGEPARLDDGALRPVMGHWRRRCAHEQRSIARARRDVRQAQHRHHRAGLRGAAVGSGRLRAPPARGLPAPTCGGAHARRLVERAVRARRAEPGFVSTKAAAGTSLQA